MVLWSRERFCSRIKITFDEQICHICSDGNPQVIVELPLHLQKVTIWWALGIEEAIGPYFLKNEAVFNVTVNAERYRAMIKSFFVSERRYMPDSQIFNTPVIEGNLFDSIISRHGLVECPSRSSDLTPLVCFWVWLCEDACLHAKCLVIIINYMRFISS